MRIQRIYIHLAFFLSYKHKILFYKIRNGLKKSGITGNNSKLKLLYYLLNIKCDLIVSARAITMMISNYFT